MIGSVTSFVMTREGAPVVRDTSEMRPVFCDRLEAILATSTESTEKKYCHGWSKQIQDHWIGGLSEMDIRKNQDQQSEEVSGRSGD
jgi:hypothetical protein